MPPLDLKEVPEAQWGQSWKDYAADFKYKTKALGKEFTNERLKDMFLGVCGRQVQKIYESLNCSNPREPTEEGHSPYEEMMNEFDAYFAPRKHEAHIFFGR